MPRPRTHLATCCTLVALCAVGCVEPNSGSYLQFNLLGFRAPCELLANAKVALPEGWPSCSGDPIKDRTLLHYELFATVDRRSLFRLLSFGVQRAVYPVEHEALERDKTPLPSGSAFQITDRPLAELSPQEQGRVRVAMSEANAVYAITSHTQERLGADGRLLPGYYLGNQENLNQPRNGTFYGQVDGPPLGGGVFVVGGAIAIIPHALERLDSLMITIEHRRPDRQPATPSPLVVVAGPTTNAVRGTINAELGGVIDSSLSASFVAYPGLDRREFF